MDPDRKAYYVLTELFAHLVPKALSKFLQRKMREKLNDDYAHSLEWWKPKRASLSRAPPTGNELATFLRKGPEEWEMNLLLKVIKYSNYELLERYETEWDALDILIDTRAAVFESSGTKRVSDGDKRGYFTRVGEALGNLDLVDELIEAEDLQSKTPTKEEGEKFHEVLKRQDTDWKAFTGKLYERGKAPLPEQLEAFNTPSEQKSIVLEASTQVIVFGTKLLKDKTGARVDGIRRARIGDPVDATREIMHCWLRGEGVPTTWDNLVKCMYHAGLNAIAKDVEDCLI